MPRWLGLGLVLVMCLPGWGAARAEPLPPVAIGFFLPVIRDIPRKDVEISLRFGTDELARSLNLTYKPIEFYDDLAMLKRDMEAGKVNFLVANAMGVVQHFSDEELADGFSGYKHSPDYLYLVVRRDAGVHNLANLAGKRIGLLDGDELSDVYLDTLLMKAWGRPDRNRLGPITREARSSKLAHRLFFGQIDAALIFRSGYEAALALNPQIGERLEVLEGYTFKARSPHIGLFSAHVRPEHREQIIESALKLNDTERGRQVMRIYHSDSMVRTPVRDLVPFRELLHTHRSLKAASGPVKKPAR